MQKKGFTLVELMVVVVIIGVLAAIALPSYGRMRCKADWSELQGTLADISLRMENYRTNHGRYPTANQWAELGYPGTPYVGKHYEAYISSTARTYIIAMKDTLRPLNCSGAAGFENDIWVKINSAPEIIHHVNTVNKTTAPVPAGYTVP